MFQAHKEKLYSDLTFSAHSHFYHSFFGYRKQRKRSDGSKGGSNKSSSNNLMPLFPSTSPHNDQSDHESDTTAEPQSEPEDFDDRKSDSIASSEAIHEFELGESDVKGRVPVVEVSESDGTPNGI